MKTRDELIALMISVYCNFNGGRDESLAAVLDALAPELLGNPSDEETHKAMAGYCKDEGSLILYAFNNRIASISKKKTPEERVEIRSRSGGDRFEVVQDGQLAYTFESFEQDHAVTYREGLIAQLHKEAKQ